MEGGEYLARGDGCFLPRNADPHGLLQLIRVVENSGSGSPICYHERSSVWIAWEFCAICFGKSVDFLALRSQKKTTARGITAPPCRCGGLPEGGMDARWPAASVWSLFRDGLFLC